MQKKLEKISFSSQRSINDYIKAKSEKHGQKWKDQIYKKFLIWEPSGYNISSAKKRVIGDVCRFERALIRRGENWR